MATKIEQAINDLEDYIESCKPKPLSNGSIILVEKEAILDLIRDLRTKTPDEIRRYQKIVSNRDAILNDARQKADALINEAAIHTNELVSESEIMQQAQGRADEMVQAASLQAQDIIDQAALEANAMREGAVAYTAAQLGGIEDLLAHAVDIAALNYDKLISQLNEDIAIIQENKKQLENAATEAAMEEEATSTVYPEDSEGSDDI